jgi:hypothetical protein
VKSSAPIPTPITGECAHCGQELKQLSEFCPACGTRLKPNRRRWTVQQVAVLILAVIWTLMSGYVGTCALMFVSSEGIREIGMPAKTGYYFLAPSVVIFALCIWWIRSLLKQ